MEKQILVDTNILLRYFLKDDEKQFEEIKELFSNNQCIVLTNVIQEVIYVLEGTIYNVPRELIKEIIINSFDSIYYVDSSIIFKALDLYVEKPKLDFLDCMLIAYNKIYGINVFTYDKKMKSKMQRAE